MSSECVHLFVENNHLRQENADLRQEVQRWQMMYDAATLDLERRLAASQREVAAAQAREQALLRYACQEAINVQHLPTCILVTADHAALNAMLEEATAGHALDEARDARARRDVAGLRDAWKAKAKQLRRLELNTHREYLTLRYGLRDWLRKHDVDDTGLEVVPGLFPGTIGSALDDVAIQIRREGAEAAADKLNRLAVKASATVEQLIAMDNPMQAWRIGVADAVLQADAAIRALPLEFTASEARQEEAT